MVTQEQLTGVVLAGGRSKRMGGEDKGLLLFKNKPLVGYSINTLKDHVQHLLISANRNIDIYEKYAQVISDSLENYQGPLAGVLSAMTVASTPHLLVLPCDTPFVNNKLIERLILTMSQNQADVCVADDGDRIQPTCAIIKVDLQDDLKEFLNRGDRKFELWIKQNKYIKADCSDLAEQFVNFNRPEDLTST